MDKSIATKRRIVLEEHMETGATLRELALRSKIRRDNPWLLPLAPPELSGSSTPASS